LQDLELEQEGGEGEEGAEDDIGDEGTETGVAEEAALQAALAASMQGNAAPSARWVEDEDEEAELNAALALSKGAVCPPPQKEDDDPQQTPVAADDDDDTELQAALALSMAGP